MTEFHAKSIEAHQKECLDAFTLALKSGDWRATERLWLRMFQDVQTVIREARNARIEADALAAELSTFRPMRADKPAAPILENHDYVFTGKSPWVCMAVSVKQTVYVNAGMGAGYLQDHYTTEKKTVCGKAVTYPVTERFTSGGWPRLHELCPDCTKLLAKLIHEAKANHG